jgi:hypothetical protein
MDLKELKKCVDKIVSDLTNNGKYPKENNHIDYKKELNIIQDSSPLEIFFKNFAKDILSFANADGGIIFIGIKENNSTGKHEDLGLDETNLDILGKLDLNDVSQQFEKIIKVGISIDLQKFQMGTRIFYYLAIAKSNDTLVPINDFPKYKIAKGNIYYRASGKTEQANSSTSEFNRFLQIKANEKSKEFMEIWSNLLPEMVDINPREVLILNPLQNKVYGFNKKDKKLSGSNVEIEKTQNGIFNIILNAISAGEIGKITDNEGKPIYKIVGELHQPQPIKHITMSSLEKGTKKICEYKFTNVQLKAVVHYLGWVDREDFPVVDPPEESVVKKYSRFIWIETVDELSKREKIFFSPEAIKEVSSVINDDRLHKEIFGKKLSRKKGEQ